MTTSFLQDFVNKTRRYQSQIFCLAAGCCYFLSGQAQEAKASTPNEIGTNVKNTLTDVNSQMKSCKSKSLLDTLNEKRSVMRGLLSSARESSLLAGTDNCPGTLIPAGVSYTDAAGDTTGANNTVAQMNACIPFPAVWGPDKIYKLALPAPASRTSCTISVAPQSTFDTGVYLITPVGGGCPSGTVNSVTNCVVGKDGGGKGATETITTAQLNTIPAGTYFLFVDSFYCGNDFSECRTPGSGANECAAGNPECFHGTYTLNVTNCNMLSPTAGLAGVGGRIITAEGRGISGARVSVVLPSGETKYTLSNPFGFYHFDDIEVGQAYVFQVSGKGYQFSNADQLVTVNDSIEDLNFIASGQAKGQR
jgi:hypothetical protein